MHKNDWEKYFRSNLLLCSMYYAESCNEFARPISASLRMGNKTSFKKTSQRWLAVGNTVSNSTSPTFNIRGGQHRGPFLYRYRYRPCFFKNVSVLVPSILFSHFFDRYSLLGTSFVICPEWSFNLFKLRTDQVKKEWRQLSTHSTSCRMLFIWLRTALRQFAVWRKVQLYVTK